MKKLLVLVLVLGLAAMTNATQIWTISGSTATEDAGTVGFDVNPGDVITLTLSLDSSKASGVVINLLTDNGADGDITGIALASIFSNGNGTGMSGTDFDALLGSMEAGVSGIGATDWAYIEGFSTSTSTAADLMTVSYTVGATAGLVTINANAFELLGSDNTVKILTGDEVMAAIQLNVVPEPATMVILALGGLLLRKKK